jgi:hypothetical protein
VKWISLDPGESVGYAVWVGFDKGAPPAAAGTAPLQEVADTLAAVLLGLGPGALNDQTLYERFEFVELIVMEDWALYPWELENLEWDKCRTARLIGSICTLARVAGVPVALQGAAIKERAERAGAREFFFSPQHENRHANDAIRHGVYYRAVKGTPYETVVQDGGTL